MYTDTDTNVYGCIYNIESFPEYYAYAYVRVSHFFVNKEKLYNK